MPQTNHRHTRRVIAAEERRGEASAQSPRWPPMVTRTSKRRRRRQGRGRRKPGVRQDLVRGLPQPCDEPQVGKRRFGPLDRCSKRQDSARPSLALLIDTVSCRTRKIQSRKSRWIHGTWTRRRARLGKATMCAHAGAFGPPSEIFPRNGFLRCLLSQSRPLARNRCISSPCLLCTEASWAE